MQIGTRIGSQPCLCRRKAVALVPTPVRLIPPPSIAGPQRLSVLTCAKRGSKRSGKTSDGAGSSDDEGTASGWDAALSGIPTEDEAAAQAHDTPATAAPSQPADTGAEARPSAELDATQPSPSVSDPPEGAVTGSESKPPKSKRPKKPRSTVISLAEYGMLMAAKEAREREEAERREREARLAAGLSLTVQEPAPLELSRQGFQAFPLEGGDMELLVAETLEGRLSLTDSYVGVNGGGGGGMQYKRAEVETDVLSQPLFYQAIPWVERSGSDVLRRKEAANKIKKLYFISYRDGDTDKMDLDNVFVFDAGTRALSRSVVRLVGTPPLLEPVLRIRPQGITLEESYLLPDPVQVSESAADGLPDLDEEELAARLEELEAAAEELDELDEAPDVPGVDMM